MGFPGSSDGEESTCNAGHPCLIPGLGRSTGERIGYPLQYSWVSLLAQLVNNPPAMWEFSSVQSLSHVQLFVTPQTAARQASLSITKSWSLLKLMSIESVMPSNHLILCRPLLLCLQPSPASGSFQMTEFFASGGQSIEVSASASVLPVNIQD